MSTTNNGDGQEVNILARLLANGDASLPAPIARYLLNLHFSDGDKARMHDLVVRNQEDALSAAEQDELAAYSKAGTVLSILKSKARRTLQHKSAKRTAS